MNEERINELLESWINGNRKWVVSEIKPLGVIAVAEFMLQLSKNDQEIFTRLIGSCSIV